MFSSLSDAKLVTKIKSGAVGLLPTDTVFGLVCAATNHGAVAKLYKLKDRADRPGTVIASSIEQLSDLGIKRRYLKAVEQFWPGPVSVEMPFAAPPNYLSLKQSTIAVRIPKDKKLLALLDKTGPLLTSSANKAGEPPSKNVVEAKKVFKNSLDFYVDIKGYSGREPSAILRIIDDAIEVIRPGYTFK